MDPLRIIPAATFDPSLPPVPRFLGYTIPVAEFEKLFPTTTPSLSSTLSPSKHQHHRERQKVQVIGKPRILLRPTISKSIPHITADEFIINRE